MTQTNANPNGVGEVAGAAATIGKGFLDNLAEMFSTKKKNRTQSFAEGHGGANGGAGIGGGFSVNDIQKLLRTSTSMDIKHMEASHNQGRINAAHQAGIITDLSKQAGTRSRMSTSFGESGNIASHTMTTPGAPAKPRARKPAATAGVAANKGNSPSRRVAADKTSPATSKPARSTSTTGATPVKKLAAGAPTTKISVAKNTTPTEKIQQPTARARKTR